MVMSQESTRHAGRLSGHRPGFALIELLVARVRSWACRAVWVFPSLSGYGGSQSSRTARVSVPFRRALSSRRIVVTHRFVAREVGGRGTW